MAGIYFNISTPEVGGIDEYTKLMLHLDGDYSDVSDSNHTIATAGNPSFDSSIKKFGSDSINLDGSGDYLGTDDHIDWYFGADDFTIDCWVYLTSATTVSIYSQLANIGLDNNRIMYGFWTGYWNFYVRTSSVIIDVKVADSSPATGEWVHIALTRSGNNFRFFKNGNQIGTTQTSSAAVPNNIGPLRLGVCRLGGTFPIVMNGRMDEVRISKGIARWTSNFTPPTAPYIT